MAYFVLGSLAVGSRICDDSRFSNQTVRKGRDCEQARGVGRGVAESRSKPRLAVAAACPMATAPLGYQVPASRGGLGPAHTTSSTIVIA
jgi:hypothetical protein